MNKELFLTLIVCSLCLFLQTGDSYAAGKTGSYNFCQFHPAFPECVGWRTDAISDSYNKWFCDYVDMPKLCENKPNPEKQIMLRDQDFCCRYLGAELKSSFKEIQDDILVNQIIGRDSPNTSIAPLIIWTDKDHYNFKDKVTIYGKFDFTKDRIKKSLSKEEFDQTGRVINGTSIQGGTILSETPLVDVDIKLNGKIILRNIPVYENGWFTAYFFLNNRYDFANQNNLLEVEYILYDDPFAGPMKHATYEFTTGDIAKKDDNYSMWLDDALLPNKIRYGVHVDNPERFITLMHHDLVVTRLITPDGFIVPIKSNFAVLDLSDEFTKFAQYGHGTYQIQVTYGNNVSRATFEY